MAARTAYIMCAPSEGEFVIQRSNVLCASVLALVTILGASAAPAQTHFEQLRIIAPAAPGGGWDQTARAMQQALSATGIVTTPIVENIPGAAGTIGLARFIGAERGNGDVLLVSGLIMLGGIVTYDSPVTLADAVPIARLTGEYEALAVPAASPFRTLDDLLAAFKADPESISWGGGSVGGSDQILAGLIAAAVGVEPRRVNYIGFSGGGEALSAVLGGQVSVGINGLAEFAAQIDAGALRVLAVSSAERLPGIDAPTLRERGVDVEFENWRSVVGAAGAHRRRARTARRRGGCAGPLGANGASCSGAIVGSTAIWPAMSSRRSPQTRNGACATILRELGTRAGEGTRAVSIRCSCSQGSPCSAPRRSSRSARERRARARTRACATGARSSSSASAQLCTCCSPRARASSSPPRCSSGSSRERSTRATLRATPAWALARRGRELRPLRLCARAAAAGRRARRLALDAMSTLEGLALGFAQRADAREPRSGRCSARRSARRSACCPASARR